MTKKKNLSGSYADDEVTIIGNHPTRAKPQMQDLSVNPEVNSPSDIARGVRKREERLRRQRLINDKYNERFSMLHNGWKRATIWIVGSIGLTFLMMWFVNAILTSAGYPSAIPF